MNRQYSKEIASEFTSCISSTIRRLDADDTHRPFHSALLSDEALFWSRFERSFSTSFGQRAIQRISRLAALAGGASRAEIGHESRVRLSPQHLAAIDTHITTIRSGRLGRPPNWNADLATVRIAGRPAKEARHRVISDLWWVKNGVHCYASIKTVKPNIDQTAEAKRDLLKLKLNDPRCRPYFCLYYNPYGESRADYAWSPPKGFFNFEKDAVVLIGRDYWDTLGGKGLYDEILRIANEVGKTTRRQLEQLRR